MHVILVAFTDTHQAIVSAFTGEDLVSQVTLEHGNLNVIATKLGVRSTWKHGSLPGMWTLMPHIDRIPVWLS